MPPDQQIQEVDQRPWPRGGSRTISKAGAATASGAGPPGADRAAPSSISRMTSAGTRLMRTAVRKGSGQNCRVGAAEWSCRALPNFPAPILLAALAALAAPWASRRLHHAAGPDHPLVAGRRVRRPGPAAVPARIMRADPCPATATSRSSSRRGRGPGRGDRRCAQRRDRVRLLRRHAQIRDASGLEPGVGAFKFFAPGVGQVRLRPRTTTDTLAHSAAMASAAALAFLLEGGGPASTVSASPAASGGCRAGGGSA